MTIHASARLVLPLALAISATLAGCATGGKPQPAAEGRAAQQTAPSAPQAPADFSAALRCMDTMLLDYGTRDITVIVEDLVDPSKGAGGNAKNTLIAVVSDMTQRSRAIRLVASGKDWGNTVNAMLALKREQYSAVPQYALRGSMNLADNQSAQRGGETVPASVLAIDLTLLNTADLSVVPGIAARNSATLFKSGRNYDGRAELRKFGVTFGLSAAGGDVVGQASRALVELASIELFGRLARVPYWTCLGMTEAHQGVGAEIQDWYDAMATQPAELIKYFQTQLRVRRVYEGPIDGAVNPQLKEAVASYREALGLTREAKLSLDFFKAYLAADHRQTEAKAKQAAPAAVAQAPATPIAQATPVPAPAPTIAPATPLPPKPDTTVVVTGKAPKATPLALRVATINNSRRYAPGEPVNLTIVPSRDAHVYCFLQDEQRKIKRFFPNQFQPDSRVPASAGLQLPGTMRFELTMNQVGAQETIACFATDRDVLAQLPAAMRAADFNELGVRSLDQLRGAFAKAAGGTLAYETVLLQPK